MVDMNYLVEKDLNTFANKNIKIAERILKLYRVRKSDVLMRQFNETITNITLIESIIEKILRGRNGGL